MQRDCDIIIADTAEDESAGKVSEVYNINNKILILYQQIMIKCKKKA